MLRRLPRVVGLRGYAKSAAKVGVKPLSAAEVIQLLDTPTWGVHDLIKNNQKVMEDIPVDGTVIRRMLKISGLSEEISSEREQELITALKQQMAFIKNLYDKDEKMVRSKTSNDSNFRLIASDHIPDDPITLSKLLADIEDLPHQVAVAKGEAEGSFEINELDATNKSFFTIRTKEE